MRGPLTILIDRGLAQLPGLIFVAVGLTLLAAAVLVPAWLGNQQMRHQHDTLAHQARLMADQKERYQRFYDALAADDPQLLQRIAFAQLRVQPTDADLWPGEELAWVGLGDDRLSTTASIDAALAEPADHFQPPPPLPIASTRLIRMATGTSRLVMIAAAACFILGGIGYGSRDDRTSLPQAQKMCAKESVE